MHPSCEARSHVMDLCSLLTGVLAVISSISLEKIRSGEADSMLSQSIYLPPFMEHSGSLPCSQEPASGPYPELLESSSHP
jgi:hypothetical protein